MLAMDGERSAIHSDRRETGGGDPDGSAGGAGGRAPRGIDGKAGAARPRARGAGEGAAAPPPAGGIDGKAVAARLRAEVAGEAAALAARGVVPTLAVVLVGDDPASAVYVRNKTRAAREAGVDVRDHKLPATTTQAEL